MQSLSFSFQEYLPGQYVPRIPKNFSVERIVVTKGCYSNTQRREYIQNICRVFPGIEIEEQLNIPYNRVRFGDVDSFTKHRSGKHTLVFGEHKSSLRLSREEGNTCPPYWHFSVTGFCFYDCQYCYLAGTPGVWHSPAVRIYVNIDEIIGSIDRTANRIARPMAFYHGKLQDGLALDPLTGFSSALVPFFAGHKYARHILLTKSDEVDRLLELDHRGHTILSWSVNPDEVIVRFERNIPSMEQRLNAMKRCSKHGYSIRAFMMPLIPIDGWEEIYTDFTQRLISEVPIQRLTIGGICIYQNAKKLMEMKLGEHNEISDNIDSQSKIGDGRKRYSKENRIKMYSVIIKAAKEVNPDIELALCMEEPAVWKALKIHDRIGKCNCVL